MKWIKFGVILLLIAVFFGFSPPNDFQRTDKIEWSILTEGIEWVMEDGFYEARFSDRLKELDGKELIIEGFIFPLEYTRKHKNFIVSASPMGSCYFCGPGEAESMVFVKAEEGVDYTNQTVKMKGTFKLVSDVSKGILYELENASLIK